VLRDSFRIQDSRFRIQDSGFRIQDSGFRIQGNSMKKKEMAKFIIQTVINLLAAVLTALGATSCMR